MPNTIGRLYGIGYSALTARQFEMDTISDNLANINTPAFKAKRATFQAALGNQADQIERRGVDLSTSSPDCSQGPIETTGQAWDLAIEGDGFFVLRLPDGTPGYTRLGAFQLDGNRQLVNQQGFRVEPGITIPEGVENLSVDASGTVSGTLDGVPQEIGRLQLARFPNTEGLIDRGTGVFQPSAASGAAVMTVPTENGAGGILAGALEGANTDASQEMINILHTQRAYSLTLRALQVSDEMASLTNQLQA